MMRTRFGERLPLGNKPQGERVLGFHAITSGAGKRQSATPSVTGAPAVSVAGANQALPGKPSRGLATNFGARGIAPHRPGSRIGTKTSYQPLTMRRSLSFLETIPPALESPQLPGFMPEAPNQVAVPVAPIGNGTMNKLSKVVRRKRPFSFKRPNGALGLDG